MLTQIAARAQTTGTHVEYYDVRVTVFWLIGSAEHSLLDFDTDHHLWWFMMERRERLLLSGRKGRKGFTLIELVVAMGVLLVIIYMSLAAFGYVGAFLEGAAGARGVSRKRGNGPRPDHQGAETMRDEEQAGCRVLSGRHNISCDFDN